MELCQGRVSWVLGKVLHQGGLEQAPQGSERGPELPELKQLSDTGFGFGGAVWGQDLMIRSNTGYSVILSFFAFYTFNTSFAYTSWHLEAEATGCAPAPAASSHGLCKTRWGCASIPVPLRLSFPIAAIEDEFFCFLLRSEC